MSGGGMDAPPPSYSNDGDFLLSLLQNPDPHQHLQSTPQSSRATTPQQQQQSLALDPAVAAFGPPVNFLPPWKSNSGHDLPIPSPSPFSLSPPYPHNFLGFPSGGQGNQFGGSNFPGTQLSGNYGGLSNDSRRLGLSEIDGRGKGTVHDFVQMKQEEPKLMFGSFPCKIQSNERLLNGNSLETSRFDVAKGPELELGNRSSNGLHTNQVNSNLSSIGFQPGSYDRHNQERRGAGGAGGRGNQHHGGSYRSMPSLETRQPPPGFPSKPRGGQNWEIRDNRKGLERNVEKEKAHNRDWISMDYNRSGDGDQVRMLPQSRLSRQLDHPGLPAGSNLRIPALKNEESWDNIVRTIEVEKSPDNLHSEKLQVGGADKNQGRDKMSKEEEPVYNRGSRKLDDLGEELVESLLDESNDKSKKMQHSNSRDQNFRSDMRGQQLLSQRMRNFKSMTECRGDINRLNAPFLAIYESLIPAEEEKAKQKQLLTLLEKLVSKEWPEARLHLYGSCANSFGVSKSDIDVCLAIGNADIKKSEILLKLADILQSDNLQNVQALTRARVPIVKLEDPVTGISCDICINNVLAVVNTKLLRDYAQIDARLRQLAFIVKHWAKSRGVNKTYQGTLSSYAYVLMCIHFLQQRKPRILPCLQELERTYRVTVNDIECAYFDQVERIHDFGSRNKETIAQLVWAFFNYWAHCHDYANSVISVRTGSTISKREKDWTRRIGNDRHLICIEDPFETSHDLGRVVDKNSIRVLREEFERAADIMQHHPNPCAALFQPYIPS